MTPTPQKIQFKKQRDIGQILSDTFRFLRQHFKPLLSVLLKTTAIPFVLLLAAVGFYTYTTASLTGFTLFNEEGLNFGSIILAVSALILTVIAYNGMLNGSVATYIKAYNTGNGSVKVDSVVNEIKNNAGQFIGLAFSYALVISLATLLLILPGIILIDTAFSVLAVLLFMATFCAIIYLYVRFSLVFPSMVHHDLSLRDSFSRSSVLIKGEWWITFITLFVVGILMALIGSIFQLPIIIYSFIKTFTIVQEGALGDPASLFDGVYITLQVISNAISYLLYIILSIALNFIFYTLNEEKNHSGTLERIATIGKSDIE